MTSDKFFRNGVLAVMAVIAGTLMGCRPDATPPQASLSNAPAVPPGGEADPALSEADRLWNELSVLLRPPEYPAAWQEQSPEPEALAQWKLEEGNRALRAAAAAREFYTRSSEDERAKLAREQEYAQLNQAFSLGETNAEPLLLALENARLDDPNASEGMKLQIRSQQLQRLVQTRRQEGVKAALEEMERGARQLRADFPGLPQVGDLMLTAARGWLESGNAVRSLALVRDVLAGAPAGDVKELALALQTKLERLGQPLAIEFTALDGREVDSTKLRGHVVLVDFWATWCPPCLAAIPELRQLFEEFHPKGLEIIGISFDEDHDKLEQIVGQENLNWPHYFEQTKGGNRFGQQFQINGIPALWLLDKQGRLRDLNARDDLRGKVEKLLAE